MDKLVSSTKGSDSYTRSRKVNVIEYTMTSVRLFFSSQLFLRSSFAVKVRNQTCICKKLFRWQFSFSNPFFVTRVEEMINVLFPVWFPGIGVLMLVALTVERYLAVCRLGRTRAFAAKKTPVVAVGLALLAVSLYLPYLFRAHVITCSSMPDGLPVYRKRENPSFAHSTLWAVYLWTLEVIFKV